MDLDSNPKVSPYLASLTGLTNFGLSLYDQGCCCISPAKAPFFLLGGQSRMTRGNQRERDRERAQARTGNKAKNSKDDGLTPEQRRERDAKALQEKAAKKAAQQATGGNSAGGGGKSSGKK
ncbi:hypothetical protein SAY87_000897 [Trapa incisa]|uniref:Small EDRK-rich factor-like N-terminal domain-containing protein n=2 Tax=Trapa TaxID=22665 RepID=A0AAN7JA43_9MYRT|nr:hypothetical protein SAY87_000897 [Trapa incisa]